MNERRDTMTEPALLLTARESAALLAIGISTFYTRVSKGEAPAPVRAGAAARPRWRRADLESYVAGLQPCQTKE